MVFELLLCQLGPARRSRRNPVTSAKFCRLPKEMKNRVLQSDASEHEQKLAVQSVTAMVKGKWLERRSDELCEMASKDPKGFWRAFKTQQSNVCPVYVDLAAQFEAFRALMGFQSAQILEQADLLGTAEVPQSRVCTGC